MTVFEAKGLVKRYGRGNRAVTALDGIDLNLEQGHIYGLVGNNGAGKTTLLRLIAGLALPTEGSITLFGAGYPKGLQHARLQLGTLISEAAGYEDLSLRQNLKAQEALLPRQEKPDLRALCELAGLDKSSLRRTLRQCSTGQKQRYGLVSALLGDPEFLLLDEPMNGLDPGGVAEMRELILRLHQSGKTILISSHLLTELHKVATDYIFLRFGSVMETISAAELDRRIAARSMKDPEAYFLKLEREATRQAGSLLGRREE